MIKTGYFRTKHFSCLVTFSVQIRVKWTDLNIMEPLTRSNYQKTLNSSERWDSVHIQTYLGQTWRKLSCFELRIFYFWSIFVATVLGWSKQITHNLKCLRVWKWMKLQFLKFLIHSFEWMHRAKISFLSIFCSKSAKWVNLNIWERPTYISSPQMDFYGKIRFILWIKRSIDRAIFTI